MVGQGLTGVLKSAGDLRLEKGDEPDPGTGHNGWGCFVPDLTRLAALPCEEARQELF